MKYIFTIISVFTLLFSPILSFKEIKPKLCINCRYFITDGNTNKFGKCSLFPRIISNNYKLVNGIIEYDDDYHYCSILRANDARCGEEGKLYKKKYIRKNHLHP